MPDETEQELLERAQSDEALVRRYGDEYPDQLVAVRIDVEVPGRVLVLLSGDDSHHHEDVLRRLVGRPDRLGE